MDAEIPADKTLKIEADQTLTVGQDVKLTNNGTITGSGTIINNGTVTGMTENGITTHTGKTEWSSNNSQHWHPCAVEGCTAHKFAPAAHL